MLPAKEVRNVLPFLVRRFLKLNESAVKNDIDTFSFLFFLSKAPATGEISLPAGISYGAVSSVTLPSRSLMIRDEYCSASSALCVTMIMSLLSEIFFKISITCTLVSESSAPVGSSARIISGSLTRALAMATLCICPPDIWLGFLLIWSPRPTISRASTARLRRSVLDTPDNVSANSTLDKTV